MKREYADLRNIKDISKSEFKTRHVENGDFNGEITLVNIKEVENVWKVDTENRCILDKGYNWFAMYPKGENYAITAACDEKYNVIEWYFDICKQNGVENGVPYEDDLYLDVVIVPDGRINILDEDELLDAEKDGIITRQDVELAYNVKDKIIQKYGHDINGLKRYTAKYIDLIRQKDRVDFYR